jgi:hypothetical protein
MMNRRMFSFEMSIRRFSSFNGRVVGGVRPGFRSSVGPSGGASGS